MLYFVESFAQIFILFQNQNGIYYDVEYENAPEAIYGTKGIPLSTYTVSRGPPFYRT